MFGVPKSIIIYIKALIYNSCFHLLLKHDDTTDMII